jgi:hypothetical protein
MAYLKKNFSSYGHEELLAPKPLKDKGSDNLFNIFSNVSDLLQVFEVTFSNLPSRVRSIRSLMGISHH